MGRPRFHVYVFMLFHETLAGLHLFIGAFLAFLSSLFTTTEANVAPLDVGSIITGRLSDDDMFRAGPSSQFCPIRKTKKTG